MELKRFHEEYRLRYNLLPALPPPPALALQLISCYTNIIIFVLKWNSGNKVRWRSHIP